MARGDWLPLDGWGLSRRAIASLLGTLSLLSSRPGLDLLAAASNLTDIAIASFVVYQVAIGAPVVGLHVAWLFLGYFVYAYAPELYLDQFGDIPDARGFRAITAIVAVHFGVLFSQVMKSVPDAGAFALVPPGVTGLLVGFGAGISLFAGYFLVGGRERLRAVESADLDVTKWFGGETLQKELEQIQTLPTPTRKLATAILTFYVGAIYFAPCPILGFALAAAGTFYPIPEALVVAGIVASGMPGSARLAAALQAHLGGDIERRIAEETTDAVQSFKGFVLISLCLVALGFCGVIFSLNLSLLTTIGELVPSATDVFGTQGNLTLSAVARTLGALWFAIGVFVLFLVYALYGLFYWFRQLQRLPAYARFWHRYWQGETGDSLSTSVRRPPGLFLPGNALILLVAASYWWSSQGNPSLEKSIELVIGFGLAWPVGVAIVTWSVYTTVRGEPQPLAHEGRDILVAFLLQFVTVLIFGVAVGGFSGNPLVATFVLVLLSGSLVYAADVFRYANRQTGVADFLFILYLVGLGILLAIFDIVIEAETLATTPRVVALVSVGIIILWLFAKLLEKYVERRMRPPED